MFVFLSYFVNVWKPTKKVIAIRTFSFSVELLNTLWLLYTSHFSIYFPHTVAFITNNAHILCLEYLEDKKKKGKS